MLRTYRISNLIIRFSKYEFYNKLLGYTKGNLNSILYIYIYIICCVSSEKTFCFLICQSFSQLPHHNRLENKDKKEGTTSYSHGILKVFDLKSKNQTEFGPHNLIMMAHCSVLFPYPSQHFPYLQWAVTAAPTKT